jgi:CheY-like chemotaxis protein
MENEKRIILVVEDERPLLEAIKLKLEKNNFEVVTARSVEEAFNHIKDVPNISAVWLDHYLLGKENGLDFVVRFKQEGSIYKDIPIFVVSNTASPDKVQQYIQLGVNKYYTKAEKRLEDIIFDINEYYKNNNH